MEVTSLLSSTIPLLYSTIFYRPLRRFSFLGEQTSFNPAYEIRAFFFGMLLQEQNGIKTNILSRNERSVHFLFVEPPLAASIIQC